MAEHAEHTDKGRADDEPTRSIPTTPEHAAKPRRRTGEELRRIGDQAVGFLAAVVRWVGVLFAFVLVLHVIFTVGGANTGNGIVTFVRNWAEWVSLGFKDLFVPSDEKLRVLVNYGIAALFWLVVSAILSRIIRRLASS